MSSHRHQLRFQKLCRPRRTAAQKPPTVRTPRFPRLPTWAPHGPPESGALAVFTSGPHSGEPVWIIAPADFGGWVVAFPGRAERFTATSGELMTIVRSGETRLPAPPL
jgi:hypothetical protein